MGKVAKTFALFLTLIILMSCLTLLIVKPVNAQSIPKPSVPEFAIKLLTSQVENESTIQFTINNQHFDKSLNNTFFYYNIRFSVNGSDWREVYRPDDGFPTQSISNYTVLSFTSSDEYEGYFLDKSTHSVWEFAIVAPSNSILDVQVKAMIGYIHRVFDPNATNQLLMYPYVFTGESSDWSQNKTIKIPISCSSPTPSPTSSLIPTLTAYPSSTFPELSWLVVVPLLLLLFSVAVVLRHRKTA